MGSRNPKSSIVSAAALFAAAAWSLPGCHRQLPEPSPRVLRVVTWNIHGCFTGIDPIVDELRRLDADVICLQEAEADTTHTGGADQAASIARRLGMRHFSAGSPLPDGGQQCMAILCRQNLREPAVLDAATGRVYGVTTVIPWQGRSLRLVSVHLTSSYRPDPKHVLKTSRARSKEATDLAKRLQQWSGQCIVAGDFNSTPGMPAYDRVAKHLAGSPTTQPTYPTDNPLLPIDHILCSKGLQVDGLSLGATHASDHLPVLAKITLLSEDSEP